MKTAPPFDDLPLFAWRAPTAIIIPFPISRDVGRARRVAASVLRRQSRGAQQAEFDRAAEALAERLQRSGLSPNQVKCQMEDFAMAVNAELARLQLIERRQPGGSA